MASNSWCMCGNSSPSEAEEFGSAAAVVRDTFSILGRDSKAGKEIYHALIVCWSSNSKRPRVSKSGPSPIPRLHVCDKPSDAGERIRVVAPKDCIPESCEIGLSFAPQKTELSFYNARLRDTLVPSYHYGLQIIQVSC